jgi:hypothetical protein
MGRVRISIVAIQVFRVSYTHPTGPVSACLDSDIVHLLYNPACVIPCVGNIT